MIKKALLFLLSLCVLALFYVLVLLREDSQTRQAQQWVVAGEESPLRPGTSLVSKDPGAVSRAMGGLVPLPEQLLNASVRDASWHGHYARLLRAEAAGMTVLGVRPLSAAPLIRPRTVERLRPAQALLGFPAMSASDSENSYLYLSAGDAAYVLVRPLASAIDDDLHSLILFAE